MDAVTVPPTDACERLAPVHLAVRNGHLAALTALCALGADLTAVCAPTRRNLLHVAAVHDRVACARFVRVQPCGEQLREQCDCDGRCPLFYARSDHMRDVLQ